MDPARCTDCIHRNVCERMKRAMDLARNSLAVIAGGEIGDGDYELAAIFVGRNCKHYRSDGETRYNG